MDTNEAIKRNRALSKAEREKVCKEEFTEGNVISSHYDRRERDPKARLMCIWKNEINPY